MYPVTDITIRVTDVSSWSGAIDHSVRVERLRQRRASARIGSESPNTYYAVFRQ